MSQVLSLLSLQRHFTECLFDNEKNIARLELNAPDPKTLEQRLNIYRNNIFYSLSLALADLYPVIKRLVGDEFFKATAYSYLQEHPPGRAAMVYFGEEFPAFLDGFKHTKELVWLADVARLELAWHQSYHAPDCPPLDPQTLLSRSAEKLAQSNIVLHPSLRILKSPYPVLQIWEANQSDNENNELIDMDSAAEMVCISRPQYEVVTTLLEPGAYTFLNKLRAGTTLEQAMLAAAKQNPDFIPEQCLASCLSNGLFEKVKGDQKC